MKMRPKLALIPYLLMSLVFIFVFSSLCHAKSSEDGVCRSPYLEVSRYKWEGNNWIYLRDNDSKTFEIDDITFKVSLDEKAITVTANGKKLIYLDYRKYYSDLKNHPKPRMRRYANIHNFQGKKVMLQFLNFAPALPINGGFRLCVLQIYVESSKSLCDLAGGNFQGRFPVIPPFEKNYK
jgi:hypothetical protein